MSILEVNLFDNNFDHSFKEDGFYTASAHRKPQKIKWIKNLETYDGFTIFTDDYIFSKEVNNEKLLHKIAWCNESPAIRPLVYEQIHTVENKFENILTFSEDLLKRGSKYILSPIGSTRINDNDAKLYDKTRLISLIASFKTETEGHRLRHTIARNCTGIDLWGSGYKRMNEKTEALAPYMYTIAIMNFRTLNYFTEILIDCFRTGTIPIFWGAPNIQNFFDIRGIYVFSNIEELKNICKNINKHDYYSKIDYVKNNFEIAKQYISTDDIIADILNKVSKNA